MTYTMKQISDALKVTKRAVEMRAAKECWTYTEKSCRGGKRRLYALEDLPQDVVIQLTERTVSISKIDNEIDLLNKLLAAADKRLRQLKRLLGEME